MFALVQYSYNYHEFEATLCVSESRQKLRDRALEIREESGRHFDTPYLRDKFMVRLFETEEDIEQAMRDQIMHLRIEEIEVL